MSNYVDKICLNCGVLYTVLYKKRHRKYCSLECAYEHRTYCELRVCACVGCDETFEVRKNSSQKYCSKKCAGKMYSATFKWGEEDRKKMSERNKGKTPWNKGLTAEDDERILAGEDNPSFGVIYCTKETHPEWAKKVSETSKRRGINRGDKNGMKQPEARAKLSATRKEMLKDPEKRAKISEQVKKAWVDGKFDGVRVGQCKWYAHTKPDGTIVKLQGTWEVAFARWADAEGLIYETHKGRIPYINSDEQERSYYPDFWFKDLGCYIEIKNEYHMELQEEKFVES